MTGHLMRAVAWRVSAVFRSSPTTTLPSRSGERSSMIYTPGPSSSPTSSKGQ